MFNFRFILLFWITTTIGLHAVMFEKHIYSLILSSVAPPPFSLSLKRPALAAFPVCLLRPRCQIASLL